MVGTAQEESVLTSDEVFAAFDRVLAGPAFRVAEPTWIERAIGWVKERWSDFTGWVFEQLGAFLGGNPGLAKLLLILLVTALVALLVYLVWSMLAPEGRAGVTRKSKLEVSAEESVVPPRADEVLRRARELAREGRYAEAMHALYLGTLLQLDEGGRVRFEEGKTGGEYARELNERPLRAAFRGLLQAFYPVAFGGRPAAEASWLAMDEAAQSLGGSLP